MISPASLYNCLRANNINFYTGVPDSLLKDFCAYITDNTDKNNNIIAANEGNAISLAAGYNLATNEIGLVYMQNSGLGNSINPLLSLVDEKVYKIPMLLMIGWRGEPGKKDACQHIKQGEITIDLLNTMNIKHSILPNTINEAKKIIDSAHNYMQGKGLPYAIVVKKGTFAKYTLDSNKSNKYPLKREDAIEIILSKLKDEVIISTTGKISREVYELRDKYYEEHNKDFLMVGSMGHASQIALSISLQNLKREVYCLDGDGALIMHMGGITTVGNIHPHNFKHIVFNNGAHDSVGGQPTVGLNIDLCKIARGSGYNFALQVSDKKELEKNIDLFINSEGPSLLEVKVRKGAREDLGRPEIGAYKRKELFMNYLRMGEK